ncbi:MAG: hypothetical protein KKH93_04550 [Candidatus Omnitrophica bacterium]|nr:hypothetical protein [Candidatus Omnitrophota bacterium]
MRHADNREREKEILGLIIESYIKESRPISSGFLCEQCRLNCSPATVRNIMLSLEQQGLVSHIHTSSGRVPTKEGFKRYVESLTEEEIGRQYPVSLESYALVDSNIDDIISFSLDNLARLSGYASLIAVSGREDSFSYKGMRFILEQPEFEDIKRLRHIFYALEVRMGDFQHLLFDCFDEKMKILIGDDIGFEEISDCSLVISGLRQKNLGLSLALLGPMRMNYAKAVSCLNSVRNQLKEAVEGYL